MLLCAPRNFSEVNDVIFFKEEQIPNEEPNPMNGLKSFDIRALLEVLMSCNVSLSADKLGCTQSYLSRTIAIAEKRFNASIFYRDTRPIRPTEFGRNLIPLLRACEEGNNNLIQFIEHHNKNPAGNVRIYSPSGIQAFVSRNILIPLNQLHPDIIFNLQTVSHTLNDRRFGTLFDDECDILISYIQPRDTNLISRKIVSLDMNIYASDFYHQKAVFQRPDELCEKDFILLAPLLTKDNTNVIMIKNINTNEYFNINVKGKFIFDNAYTALQLCRSGYGYLLASSLMIQDFPEIKPRLPDHFQIKQDYFITYRQKAYLPDRVKESIDYIVRFPFTSP